MPPTKRRRSVSPKPKPDSSSSNKKANTSSSSSATKNRPSTDTNTPSKKQGKHKEWKQWKQQQIHDYNTHQFLDASATVHAGLFGARRLPEIKSLWRGLVQGELNSASSSNQEKSSGVDFNHGSIRRAGESGGGKISSRHLRRRTNSHRRKRRFRFFPAKDATGLVKGDAGDSKDDMMDDVTNSKSSASSSVKPEEKDTDAKNGQKQKCRRARRKPALLKQSHSHWGEIQTQTQLIHSTTNEKTKVKLPHKWIPSHLWHAKRFHMSPPLFSWSIPLLHCNRGSRASLRLASSDEFPKCTIQDATWEINGCAIKLQINVKEQSMQTLVSLLGRVCGTEARFLTDESVLMGQTAGEGLIHEVDACPLKPIGPATFLLGFPNDSGDGSKGAHVSIFAHPAIHRRVLSLLAEALPSHASLSTVPLTLLRVRGRASISALTKVLSRATKFELVDKDDYDHCSLIELGTPSNLISVSNKGSEPVQSADTSKWPLLLKLHRPNQAYQHLPHNLACSGWDIICAPSVGSSLFQSLVTSGGACPIGLLEDARAQLEAYPPLPIFPRDFPDTEDGKLYWEQCPKSAATAKEEDEERKDESQSSWKDWIVIRACIEGSWGRNNTMLRRTKRHWKQDADMQKSKSIKEENTTADEVTPVPELAAKEQVFGRDSTKIHWPSLVAPEAESTIVVRGSFGIPFLQLFHGCGRLSRNGSKHVSQPESSSGMNSKRQRRPRRPPNSTVSASPLSMKDSEAHSNMCQQLKASLSLPAMLRCELYCNGKGTFNVGDMILALSTQETSEDASEASASEDGSDTEENTHKRLPLGVVVAGGFSPSRGLCHGVGFVGAAKLIDALDGTIHGKGIIMPQSNGQKKMALEVLISRDTSECDRYALLSILL